MKAGPGLFTIVISFSFSFSLSSFLPSFRFPFCLLSAVPACLPPISHLILPCRSFTLFPSLYMASNYCPAPSSETGTHPSLMLKLGCIYVGTYVPIYLLKRWEVSVCLFPSHLCLAWLDPGRT
ncbi:uncharacterized protein LY79DRAFT_545797 [Colletotrichum navitas]|uniref:Uncharacterized protein n=1 Tax=Colletotrichum navitas TaxID=681940 RepID=A0AAD8Q5Z2_9PEZI|nr:uncharacterized protein LY79DRAFT_545797 [Colletotrichum navitas]KAK1595707.1 hypothetical protein LY79DRAFT_545797 [Colletotrichum navitas]